MKEKEKFKQKQVSLSNPEFQKRFRSISESSGGSAVGRGFDGGSVVESRYGEFACHIEPGGELLAYFPDRGIVCGYLINGKLAFAGFDLAVLFNNLEVDVLQDMAHGGRDILELIESLERYDEKLFLAVFPELGTVRVKLSRNDVLVVEKPFEYGDFSVERFGRITLEETTLAYSIARQADELIIGFGEVNDETMTLCSVSISHQVDFVKEMMSGNHKELKALAGKILLND